MAQTETRQNISSAQNGARDLLAKLYREIGISAVAAALESNRRATVKQADPAQNPAVIRDEKAA